eukprot:s3271_g2.t1
MALVAALVAAGVALGDICLRFVWQVWHKRRWAGSGGGLGRGWSLGRCAFFCVAGVALGDICLRFVWQAWHLVTSAFALCGRRGTNGTGLALVAALVAAGRHLVTSAFALCGRRGTNGTGLALVAALVAAGRWGTAPLLRGRRGTWRGTNGTGLALVAALVAAGVALGDICLRFVWQAWHKRRWAGSGGGLGRGWSLGRRASFAWQAWRLVTSAFVLCGRRGTNGTGLALVAALVAAGVAQTALGWLWWRPWSRLVAGALRLVLSASRGTNGTGLALVVALVAALVAAGRWGAAPLLRGRRGTW